MSVRPTRQSRWQDCLLSWNLLVTKAVPTYTTDDTNRLLFFFTNTDNNDTNNNDTNNNTDNTNSKNQIY